MLFRPECKIVTNPSKGVLSLLLTQKLFLYITPWDWIGLFSPLHHILHYTWVASQQTRQGPWPGPWLPLPALAGPCPPWGNSNRNSSPPSRKAAWSPGTGLTLLPGLVTYLPTWLGSPIWPEASSCPGPHSWTPRFCLGLCPLGMSEFWPWLTSSCTEPCAAPSGPCGTLLDMYGWTRIIRSTILWEDSSLELGEDSCWGFTLNLFTAYDRNI